MISTGSKTKASKEKTSTSTKNSTDDAINTSIRSINTSSTSNNGWASPLTGRYYEPEVSRILCTPAKTKKGHIGIPPMTDNQGESSSPKGGPKGGGGQKESVNEISPTLDRKGRKLSVNATDVVINGGTPSTDTNVPIPAASNSSASTSKKGDSKKSDSKKSDIREQLKEAQDVVHSMELQLQALVEKKMKKDRKKNSSTKTSSQPKQRSRSVGALTRTRKTAREDPSATATTTKPAREDSIATATTTTPAPEDSKATAATTKPLPVREEIASTPSVSEQTQQVVPPKKIKKKSKSIAEDTMLVGDKDSDHRDDDNNNNDTSTGTRKLSRSKSGKGSKRSKQKEPSPVDGISEELPKTSSSTATTTTDEQSWLPPSMVRVTPPIQRERDHPPVVVGEGTDGEMAEKANNKVNEAVVVSVAEAPKMTVLHPSPVTTTSLTPSRRLESQSFLSPPFKDQKGSNFDTKSKEDDTKGGLLPAKSFVPSVEVQPLSKPVKQTPPPPPEPLKQQPSSEPVKQQPSSKPVEQAPPPEPLKQPSSIPVERPRPEPLKLTSSEPVEQPSSGHVELSPTHRQLPRSKSSGPLKASVSAELDTTNKQERTTESPISAAAESFRYLSSPPSVRPTLMSRARPSVPVAYRAKSPGPSPAMARRMQVFDGDVTRSASVPMPGHELGVLGIRTNNPNPSITRSKSMLSPTLPSSPPLSTSQGPSVVATKTPPSTPPSSIPEHATAPSKTSMDFKTPELSIQQHRANVDYGLASLSLPLVDSGSPDLTQGRRGGQRPKISQFASSKNALIEALTTPVRKQKEAMASIDKTPRTLKNGFVELNSKKSNPFTPGLSSFKELKSPRQRCMDTSHHGGDKAKTFIDYALDRLPHGSGQQERVKALVAEIERLGGFPKTRRLSLRDNDLVGQMIKAVRNDPNIVDIEAHPSMFGTISSTLLSQCIDSLKLNLHVQTLTFQGVELGNDFLYQLATSMEYNFTVKEIDLSSNCFTSEGIAQFCQSLAYNNETVTHLNLKNQTTPISEASQADVIEAFEQNKVLMHVELDFVAESGRTALEAILQRNRNLSPKPLARVDQKLICALSDEVERAQELWEQQQDEQKHSDEDEIDWDYGFELAELFDRHKLKKEAEENSKIFMNAAKTKRTNADDLTGEQKTKFLFGDFMKSMEDSVMAFNEDGSFLTPEFIAKYFQERPEEKALTFDFHGQWKLFKRFPVHDPARQRIVDRFVHAIAHHPRANEITGINMANTAAGDDFLISLSRQCLENPSLLPNLHMVNFETNYMNELGIVALSKLMASNNACRHLQVIRLENQKGLLKSRAEFALAKAMRTNRSVVVLSLTLRNLLERERIGKYILRNIDFIRQARQERLKASGQQRERNAVEQLFDRVSANDASVGNVVNMVGNERFLTLTQAEKIKAAKAFGENCHVKELILNGCGIDDAFARALADSFMSNKTLEKVNLEGNDLSGEGIKYLFEGLGKNSSIKEIRLHKQSKIMATVDEELLPDLLQGNTSVTKLGLSCRSQTVNVKLDRLTKHNINLELKEKAAAKGEEFVMESMKLRLF